MSDLHDHPIANIFPLLDTYGLETLAEDIRQHGLREPIWLYEGQILDGRNRFRACLAAKADPAVRVFEGTPLEAIAFVWSANRVRRQLSPSQAAIADARREKLLQVYAPVREAAKERQREHGGTAPGRSKGTLPELVPEVKAGDRETRALRAKAAGTNAKYIDLADRLVEERPELAEKVGRGELSLTQAQRTIRAEEVTRQVSLPDAKYRVVYADPPWSYGNTQPDYHVVDPRDHYPVMPLADICALPVRDLCEDNAVLFLWVTSPMLEESFQVVRAWGFKYKTSWVWDKVKHNMGHYNSVRHEFLLVCTRGSCPPDVPRLFDSVQTIERTAHSAKPEEFRQVIDAIYPHGKRIELFARQQTVGWDGYGYEAPVS